MLSFSRKTDYALVALTRLAQARLADGEPVSARQIASEYQGLPLPLLMNVLKDLQRAGIVSSTRGARGGYVLAQAPQRISIAGVVEAIEGPLQITMCCNGHEDPADGDDDCGCQLSNRCPVSPAIHRLHQRVNRFFEEMTLEDICNARVDVPVGGIGAAASERSELTRPV